MAIDRRELLRRVGMGGLGAMLTPLAVTGMGRAPLSTGEILLPESQVLSPVPASLITQEVVLGADFGGWYLTEMNVQARPRGLAELHLRFVASGTEGPDRLWEIGNRWGMR